MMMMIMIIRMGRVATAAAAAAGMTRPITAETAAVGDIATRRTSTGPEGMAEADGRSTALPT